MIDFSNDLLFTNQVIVFDSVGQISGPTPPPVGEPEFTLYGFDLTEHFVTDGTISAMGVSYTINSLSRRTV